MSALALGSRLRRHTRPAPRGSAALPIQLVVFAALLGFAAAHWGMLIEDTPGGRIALVVLVVTAGAAALAASHRLRLPPAAATAVRVGIALATTVLAFGAIGLPVKLLWPWNWDDFADGLDRGLSAMNSFAWPYEGEDEWVRLTVMLGIPAAAVPAALLSFWPAREADAARGRLGALVMLLALYGMAVTERGLESPVLRGLALLLLVAAWLWLPRLASRDALAAALAVGACTLLAIPLATSLDRDTPWVNYDDWTLFSSEGGGTRFAWDHQYGPIDWPRDGTPLLDFRSRESHYWKAETLDHFDGLRWIHSNLNSNTGPGGELPRPLNPRWIEDVRVTVRRLRSELIVTPGTPLFVAGDKSTRSNADGTTHVIGEPLERGDSYRVRAYVPDPTVRQMRAAEPTFPEQIRAYAAFTLPERGQSGLRDDPVTEADRTRIFSRRTVVAPFAGETLTRADERRVLASPYGETYRLARNLAAGQATTYDTVKSVQRYLLSDRFEYTERPPSRRYPLASFLFEDRAGYCQQFSGAMALMLRMNGIPARVAAGFAPGVLDKERGEYRVRDLDAHSWVEVWFTGVGWVPFDPTPPLSPAESQASGLADPSAARGALGGSEGATRELQGSDGASAGSSAASADDGGSGGLIAAFGLLLAAIALTLAGLWLHGHPRVRRGGHVDEATELRAAMERLGRPLPPRTTLSQLERRLELTSGREAARYARLVRERRYAPPGGRGPTRRDRRALRRALAAGAGPLGRLKALVALPPRRAF